MATPKKNSPKKDPEMPEKKNAKAPPQPRTPEPFDWFTAHVPLGVCAPEKNLDVRRREVSERAALLRRLGYGKEEVCARLCAYQVWEYEPFHKSPLSVEVPKLVDAIFGSAKARISALEP